MKKIENKKPNLEAAAASSSSPLTTLSWRASPQTKCGQTKARQLLPIYMDGMCVQHANHTTNTQIVVKYSKIKQTLKKKTIENAPPCCWWINRLYRLKINKRPRAMNNAVGLQAGGQIANTMDDVDAWWSNNRILRGVKFQWPNTRAASDGQTNEKAHPHHFPFHLNFH